MKKICLLISFIAIAYSSYAQTNTFPTSGNVGIGTTSPTEQLTVAGHTGKVVTFGNDLDVSGQIYAVFGVRALFGYNGSTQNAVVQGIGSKGIEFNVNSGTFGLGQAMVINSNGNVGVGLTSPESIFDVRGPNITGPVFTLSSPDAQSIASGTILGTINWSAYDNSAGRVREPESYIRQVVSGTWDGYSSPSYLSFGIRKSNVTFLDDAMVINNLGDVGVGTGSIAPVSLFEVSSSTGHTAIIPTTISITSTTDDTGWDLTTPWANLDFYSKDLSGTGPGARARIGAIMENASGANTGLAIFTNNGTALSEVARFSHQGYLGIGTTTPTVALDVIGDVAIGTTTPATGYKLSVNGSAIATSMTVQVFSSWPDFVFKKEYHLPALEDVKTYIDQNQHLPDVPTAADMQKSGIDLGAMNQVLLKKVEELTLYMVQLNKQLEAQQEEIEQLKKK
jgi:hypothetical protein